MTSTMIESGSAEQQGALWGARPSAWASTENRQGPTYEEAISRIGIDRGDAVLDVGCGAGTFLRLAADRGARTAGIDAAASLIEVARTRVPEANLRVGDLQWLPYPDDSFDLVTGFNSFFFAADMVAALREAKRVAKPEAPVLVQVWGRPERCDLSAMLGGLESLRPSRTADPPPPLWRPGVLEEIAGRVGLTPDQSFDLEYALEYPDEATLLRGMLGAGGVVEAANAVGEETVRRVILESLAPHRTADGGYRLSNEWHFLVATA